MGIVGARGISLAGMLLGILAIGTTWAAAEQASLAAYAGSAALSASNQQAELPEFPAPPETPPVESPTPYAQWKNGPGRTADYFPIAVWLQSPKNAARYKAAGINLYVGLWKGPTEEQLEQLRQAGMPVICSLNEVARRHLDDPIIVGWMHGDEPDNAQRRRDGKPGWGPPIPPQEIVAAYRRIRSIDPTRPVLLNLGQGVAWDGWHGRGVRTRHPEDYPKYVQGADIVSFDIYPVVSQYPQVKGRLWYVPYGVARLRYWTGYKKPVWNCIECTHIGNPDVKPTGRQVRSEVWMALIHGSRGLIYFVHQFKPRFVEAGLLADPEMLAAVTEINRQIHQLAPVLNSPTLHGAVTVHCSPADVPIATMTKRFDGHVYLFTAAMLGRPVEGTFQIKGLPGQGEAEVLGEDRTIAVTRGRFSDHFGPYEVHLYRIAAEE